MSTTTIKKALVLSGGLAGGPACDTSEHPARERRHTGTLDHAGASNLALATRASIGMSDFARDEQRGPIDGLRPILRSVDPEGQRASNELAHSDAITPATHFT
jgi:hypothetical protein